MGSGDWLEMLEATEFPLIIRLALEAIAADNLYGARRTDGIERQPHFPIAAPSDGAQQLMIWDRRGW